MKNKIKSMKFFKTYGIILACLFFLFPKGSIFAYEQKQYAIDTFFEKRLFLGFSFPQEKNHIKKIKPYEHEVFRTQRLFWENILILSFLTPETLSPAFVPAHYFLTAPSWKVEKRELIGSFVSSGGFLLPNQRISVMIPLSQKGNYEIWLFDRYGFNFFHTQYTFWNILNQNKSTKLWNRSADPFDRINHIRESIWEQKLKKDNYLRKIANKKIDDMIAKKYFWHEDRQGNNFVKNISNRNKRILGENLARWTQRSHLQSTLEDSWAHRYTMQFPKWTKVGIATRKWPDDLWYMVQIFWK